MIERKTVFEQYINSFKKMSIESKKQEIIYSLKELLAVFDALSINEGIKLEYLKSNEILDIKENSNIDDDFLERIDAICFTILEEAKRASAFGEFNKDYVKMLESIAIKRIQEYKPNNKR